MKYFMIVLLITLLTINGSYCSWSSMTSPLKSMWLSLYSSSEPSIKSSSIENDCRGCAQNHVEEDEVDPILTELRVEYVKQQILRKLRLEKPPEVSLSLSTLPKPLINGHVLELKPGEPLEPQIPAESFYGKTNQIVVFPDKGIPSSKKCQQSSNHITGFNPAVCFTFFLPNEMQFVAATSAELWFYKEKDKNDNFNQTFVLSELDHWDQRRSFEKNTIMAIFETTIGEGWVKTDVSFAVRKWVEKQRLNHSIQIACSTCKIERNAAPVSLEARLKPFLVVQTSPLPQRYRPKRNSNCQPEMKECCRDELYISFEDIGWSDWILHPSGYHAYFCRGSCSTAVSLTMSGTHHNDVIRIRSETELLREGVLNMAQGAQYIYRGCISCNHEIHHLSSFVSLRRSIRLWSFLVSQSECAPSTVWFSDFDILYFLYKSLCLFYINNLIKYVIISLYLTISAIRIIFVFVIRRIAFRLK